MTLAALFLAVALTCGPARGAEPAHSTFADVVRDHFAAWDLNHDGKIEGREIDTLMSRRSIRGDAAAALAVLKLRERRTPAPVRPGFTLSPHDIDDLDSLTDPVALDPAKGPPKPFHAEASFKRYLRALEAVDHSLYANSGPDFDAMKQGPIGGCYFFCLTAFLAAKDPDKIHAMKQRAANGNYMVKFFDGESFSVSAPTEAELLVNNSTSSLEDGVWLCVLEKALGKRLRAKSKDAAKRTADPTDAMASGGSTATVMMLYSGHKVKGIKLRDAKQADARLQELRREIPLALTHGRMASVEMGGEPPSGSSKVL